MLLFLLGAIPSDDQVRITPSLKDQRGGLWAKTKSTSQYWEIEVFFKVSGRGRIGGDGLVSYTVLTNIFSHTHTNMHACTHVRIHVCTHACMHVCMHACTHAHTKMQTHAQNKCTKQTHTHTHTQQTHTHTPPTHAHTYIVLMLYYIIYISHQHFVHCGCTFAINHGCQ